MGVPELGVAYATGQDTALAQAAVRQAAQEQSVKVQRVHSAAQLTQPIVLFVRGDPRTAYFCGATEIASRAAVLRDCAGRRQSAGAGADGQPAKAGCQSSPRKAVPLVSASARGARLPRSAGQVVRRTPSPQGLAGLLQRGTRRRVLQQMTAPLTRANVLAALQQRKATQCGRVDTLPRQKRSAAFVTQSMLSSDGRIVG